MHRFSSPAPALMICLLTAFTLVVSASARAAGPDIVLKDTAGNNRNVNAYIGQGRWTIVAVWSADCPICRRDIYHMTFLHEEHKGKDAQVLGLSVDGHVQRDKVIDFIDEQSLNFANLIGTPADASRLSGRPFRGTPTYYFFAPDGRFMTERVGSLTQAQAEQVLAALVRDRVRLSR